MSQENVEVYKRAVDATNRRDLDALLDEFDPDVEWHSALVGMGTEVYRGHCRKRFQPSIRAWRLGSGTP